MVNQSKRLLSMILLHPLIDDSKNTCGKVDSVFLSTFPQDLLLRLLWLMSSHKRDISTLGKRGHLYFGEKGTFLLWVDTRGGIFMDGDH